MRQREDRFIATQQTVTAGIGIVNQMMIDQPKRTECQLFDGPLLTSMSETHISKKSCLDILLFAYNSDPRHIYHRCLFSLSELLAASL